MSKLKIAGLLLWTSAAWAQQPILDVSGATFRPTPLAAAAPTAQDEGAKKASAEFDAALTYDLSACGLFQLLDRKSFLSDAKEGVTAASINFTNWSNVGAELLVKTQLSLDGDTLKGDVRLFGVAAGHEDFKASEAAPAKDPRRLAHKLANQVYKFLTRETGPFETHLAFVRLSAKGRDVYVSDWDGRNSAALTQGNINVLPTVLPGGGGAAYTSYRRGKPELFSQRLGADPKLLVSAGRMASGVAYSPDGKQIAYSVSDGENAEVYLAAADGSGARKLTDTKYYLNSSPSWSPDGKRLAFVSNRAGTPQIYVMGADGSAPKRLTFQGNYNTTPQWSPRGDLIAFTARDERNAFDLFTVTVDGGKVNRLTQDSGNNEEPTFSPNGRLLIFTSTRLGPRQLFVMTATGANQVALPVERGEYATPDWGQ